MRLVIFFLRRSLSENLILLHSVFFLRVAAGGARTLLLARRLASIRTFNDAALLIKTLCEGLYLSG